MKRNNEYKRSYIEGLIMYIYDVTRGVENELMNIMNKIKKGQVSFSKKIKKVHTDTQSFKGEVDIKKILKNSEDK